MGDIKDEQSIGRGQRYDIIRKILQIWLFRDSRSRYHRRQKNWDRVDQLAWRQIGETNITAVTADGREMEWLFTKQEGREEKGLDS